MTTHWFSLRRRLLLLLLGGVTLAWTATLLFSYQDAHHEVDEVFDAQLAQSAQVLLALVNEQEEEGVEPLQEPLHKYQRQFRFQIWTASGQLKLRSVNAPETPMSGPEGFSDFTDGAGQWRQFATWNSNHSLLVRVSENHQVRNDLAGHIAARILVPALLGLPLIALWVWFATWKGFSVLDALARQIAGRDAQQLKPIKPATAPREVKPMVDALNELFLRVESVRELEHQFTADAAHELRTPLAALQAQLQVALRAQNEAERNHALEQLQAGISRASHLVEQMLALARLEPGRGVFNPSSVDLGQTAELVCAELGAAIVAKDLDFELTAQPDCKVGGQPEWIRILMRNLVDNAAHYTPQAGRVQVKVEKTPSGCSFSVKDDGPGISPEQRESALKPFHRLHQGDQPGTGLGLAIVDRIAEIHGASLDLGEGLDGKGLGVTVTWPA